MRTAYVRVCFALLCFLLFIPALLKAQFPYSESFKNATANGMVISGSAQLTAAAGVDAPGQGYLRLTDNTNNNVGYVYGQTAFPSSYGFSISFEFFSYKPGALSYNQADGISFFLFDASVNAFRPGGTGGSLGYAQYYSTPGMAKGYMGIAIDEYGNFSSPYDGGKIGGPGQTKGSVVIRGPGNGKSNTDYVYQTGVVTANAPYNIGFSGFTQRYPDPSNPNYRKLKIVLNPGSSAGASTGYTISVIMYKGGSTLTPVTLISNFDYPFPAPAQLKYGLAGSTGSNTDFHEIRSMAIDPANTAALVPPVLQDDNGVVVCQGGEALLDVTANDASANTGGAINKATVDLDPATSGLQTSMIDPGKGTYSVDATGIVTFSPVSGFTGVSTILYTVADNYGMVASTPAHLNVTVNGATAPSLTLSDPSAVCAPATVDITNAALKSNTSPGAVYDYFASLTAANTGTPSINVSANALTQSGTYYIRASLNGCATIQPISVRVHSMPSSSNAGTDQTFCSSTGGQGTTLLGSNPDVGMGTWSQVSGPSTAAITYPNAASSPVSGMAQGVYVFRWTVSNGACPANTDDIQITVGVPSNAGSSQVFANASTTTLSANAPAPGTGVWTQVSGPALTINNPASPSSTLSGLVPGNTYVLAWKVTNGSCVNSSQVTLTDVLNTIADAGPDQTLSPSLPLTVSGNTPGTGNTGAWSLVSKPADAVVSISDPNNAVTNISGVTSLGDYTFRWTITNGSYSNFDEMTVHVVNVLSVHFLSFEASRKQEAILLSWKTGAEENNDHFEIQASLDGRQFQTIGEVPGLGNGGGVYGFTDDRSAEIKKGVYYRIMQVDRSGSSTFSKVINIASLVGNSFNVWPNPFTSQLQVSVLVKASQLVKVELLTTGGQLLQQATYEVLAGQNTMVITPLSKMRGGLLWVRIYTKDGTWVQKVIRQ